MLVATGRCERLRVESVLGTLRWACWTPWPWVTTFLDAADMKNLFFFNDLLWFFFMKIKTSFMTNHARKLFIPIHRVIDIFSDFFCGRWCLPSCCSLQEMISSVVTVSFTGDPTVYVAASWTARHGSGHWKPLFLTSETTGWPWETRGNVVFETPM